MPPPLTKKWDNFLSFGPFVMFLGVLERRGVGATFAFGFMKKYLFSKKLEHKTLFVIFFITRFWENKKNKNFQKCSGFKKLKISKKSDNFSKVENFSTSKKIFFRKLFFRKLGEIIKNTF